MNYRNLLAICFVLTSYFPKGYSQNFFCGGNGGVRGAVIVPGEFKSEFKDNECHDSYEKAYSTANDLYNLLLLENSTRCRKLWGSEYCIAVPLGGESVISGSPGCLTASVTMKFGCCCPDY
jgi:hypothetical protein